MSSGTPVSTVSLRCRRELSGPVPDNRYLYSGSCSEDDLRWWAERFGEWRSQGREVFASFNNDGYGHAVRNALALRSLLDE